MIYNDEQFKALTQALPHFKSAKHGYIRNAPRWLTEQVINVYEAATGKTIASKSLSCAVCVLNVYALVADTYFKDEKERQERNQDNAQNGFNEAEVSQPDSGDKKKNKRGSKKDTGGVAKV